MRGISALSLNGAVVLRVSEGASDTLLELRPEQAAKLAQHLLAAAMRSSVNHETLAQLAGSLPGASAP